MKRKKITKSEALRNCAMDNFSQIGGFYGLFQKQLEKGFTPEEMQFDYLSLYEQEI